MACSSQAALQPSPSPTSSAQSAAADLRTHLDLLVAEHVMIVAKESAAAFNHADSYASYTALLAANSSDLSAIIGRAFGPTTGAQFQQVWDMQNGYLVDYAIGVVTHDDDRANGAMTGLRNKFQPQLAQLFGGIAPPDQASADKRFIDDLAAQRYSYFYSDLGAAYAQSQTVGESLTRQILQRFPDKFPGRIDGGDVTRRVVKNLLLQEHSYLATMATDAAAAGRDSEKAAAVAALATNEKDLPQDWADWDGVVVASATGPDLREPGYVNMLVAATGAPMSAVRHYVSATVRVVRDQRTKATTTLAGDDRAAATATQPIADSL